MGAQKIDAYGFSEKLVSTTLMGAKKTDEHELMDSKKTRECNLMGAEKTDENEVMDSQETREYEMTGARKIDAYKLKVQRKLMSTR